MIDSTGIIWEYDIVRKVWIDMPRRFGLDMSYALVLPAPATLTESCRRKREEEEERKRARAPARSSGGQWWSWWWRK